MSTELRPEYARTAGRPRIDVLNVPLPPAWYGEALCAQIDQDGFFPERGGSTREVKKVCAACPVEAKCLAYALDNQERFGVWGGKSERERRKILKQRELEARRAAS